MTKFSLNYGMQPFIMSLIGFDPEYFMEFGRR
jgi:hypothetical protein